MFLLIPSRVRARKTSDVNIRKHLETSGQKKVQAGKVLARQSFGNIHTNPNVHPMSNLETYPLTNTSYNAVSENYYRNTIGYISQCSS
jgi:hypothetical protein